MTSNGYDRRGAQSPLPNQMHFRRFIYRPRGSVTRSPDVGGWGKRAEFKRRMPLFSRTPCAASQDASRQPQQPHDHGASELAMVHDFACSLDWYCAGAA